MKSALIVLILTLFIGSKLIEAGGGSDECKERRDTCGGLVKPDKPSSDESGEQPSPSTVKVVTVVSTTTDDVTENVTETWVTDNDNTTDVFAATTQSSSTKKPHVTCPFTRAMYNISLTLSVEFREILQEWILTVETTILIDTSLSEDQLVVLIGYSLKNFSQVHKDVWEVISYEKFSDWGYCKDFVYVAYEIQLEKTTTIVELDSNDNCPLFDALRNATRGNGDAESDCEDLISELTEILKKSGWSYEQKMAAFYSTFKSHTEISVELKVAFESCNIEGYGSLESFLDVCLIYERSTTVSTVIGGDDCVLLEKLKECYSNTSLTITERNQIKQLHDKLELYFNSTQDINLRLKYTSQQCYSFFGIVGFNVQIVDEIELGSWGTIYDLQFISNICSIYGCGNVDDGPGSDSTTAATTVSSIQPADCNSTGSLVTIQSNNSTILIDSIQTVYNSWNATLKAGFISYFNQIKSACFNSTLTTEQKVSACIKSLSSYNKNNVYKQSVVYNITITQWEGTIAEFVECN